MPLIGLIDPSHLERREDVWGRLPSWLTVDEVLSRAAVSDPKWSPWTFELLNAAMSQHQERDYVSSSLLTAACPRSAVLERKEEYIADFDQLYAALKGTLVHRTLEFAARPGALAEWRFFTTIEDTPVSCSPDLVTVDTIWDYKNTENPPAYQYPYRKHTMQVQLNRYIVNHAERWLDQDGEPRDIPFNPRTTKFRHAVLVYLGPKGPKTLEVTKKVDVPTKSGSFIKRNMPYVWSDEEVEETFVPLLTTMNRALESYPEWPEGAEKVWGGGPGWNCPGPPVCRLPNCLAKRYPNNMVWDQEGRAA